MYFHIGYDIAYADNDHFLNKIRQHITIKLQMDPITQTGTATLSLEMLQDLVSLVNSGKVINVKALLSQNPDEFI